MAGGQPAAALQRVQQSFGVGGREMWQDEAHAQRVPVERVEEPAERRVCPARPAGRDARQQHVGVLDGFVAVEAADGQSGDAVAEPALRCAGGDQQRAARAGRDRRDEACQARALILVKRRGRARRVGHLKDRLEVVPDQQQRMLAQRGEDHVLAFTGFQARELRAECLQADRGEHAIQAERRDPRLEGVKDHQLRAGRIARPAPERLGELGLAGPARAVQHDHPLDTARDLELVEQTVAADERPHRVKARAVTRVRRLLADVVEHRIKWPRHRPRRRECREMDVTALVMHRDHPVRQCHLTLRAGSPRPRSQATATRPDRSADPISGEQPLIKCGHELGRRDRVHRVRHRDDRRHALCQQPRRDRRLELLADRARLARIEDHDRHPRLLEDAGHALGRNLIGAAFGLLEDQQPLTGRHVKPQRCASAAGSRTTRREDAVPIEVHDLKRAPRLPRLRERPRQRVERWRAQHHQLNMAAHRLQTLKQRPCDHPIADIPRASRTRDHHQHAQHVPLDREGLAERGRR